MHAAPNGYFDVYAHHLCRFCLYETISNMCPCRYTLRYLRQIIFIIYVGFMCFMKHICAIYVGFVFNVLYEAISNIRPCRYTLRYSYFYLLGTKIT